ncbi:hypothetical protein Tco_1276631 [Tanacetum coccineum]
MTTLAEHMIVAGADNRKEHGRMFLDSVLHGTLNYGTIEVDCVPRTKTYEELSDKEKLQDDCDIRATNIVLQDLPSDQERECKLYNEFDRFTSIKGESLHEYYLRFAQLINDMHTIGMTMQHVQVNTKFLNSLQPEWSKFVTDVKLARNMHTTNYDQLYAYLSQHEMSPVAQQFYSPQPHSQSYKAHHHHHHQQYQTQISSTPSVPQHAYQALPILQQPQAEFSQLDSGLAVPSILPGDDPIASLNKAISFLSTAITSRYSRTKNQLRTSSNPRNHAT